MLTAKSRKCENAFTVENRFVPAIAYLEWCGVHLDESKWKVKMDKDKNVIMKDAPTDKAIIYLQNIQKH